MLKRCFHMYEIRKHGCDWWDNNIGSLYRLGASLRLEIIRIMHNFRRLLYISLKSRLLSGRGTHSAHFSAKHLPQRLLILHCDGILRFHLFRGSYVKSLLRLWGDHDGAPFSSRMASSIVTCSSMPQEMLTIYVSACPKNFRASQVDTQRQWIERPSRLSAHQLFLEGQILLFSSLRLHADNTPKSSNLAKRL